MTREAIYSWMDKQIEAAELQNIPVDIENPFYILNASSTPGKIHVYNIDNLCKELNQPFIPEEHSDQLICHYFMYNGYKFFGLIDKEENYEGE